MMKVLIKAVMPHRQKILTQDGEEMRLQQWANKQAASSLRDAGDKPQGEQFTQSRDMLMRDAVENPDKHGLKFMGERLPFEGQNLQESLSEPDYGNSPEEQKVFEHLMSLNPEEQEVLSNNRTPDLFDSEGKLRDGMPPEEEGFLQANNKVTWKDMPSEEEFNPDKEAEHMRRIMTSRQVPMRDAWSILKEMPQCKVCQGKLEEVHPGGGEMVCMNANCPARMMAQSEGQPPRLRFPAEMFPTGGFNSLEEMTENARNNPDYSKDLYY